MYSTAEVAAMAGVHKDTLLRWLKERIVQEPCRDRHGWRVFSSDEAAAVVALAKAPVRSETAALAYGKAEIERLKAVDWDFASAKTGYLTHNLHPYPAKYIPQIPNTLIQELSSVGETVADIFCGSGTTLVEALQLRRHAIGIDANPLAALISEVKSTTLTAEDFDNLLKHRKECEQFLSDIEPQTGDLFYDGKPFRSSGWRPSSEICEFWFDAHVVEELAELRQRIERLDTPAVRALCQVALSAIIVAVSKQDSDTRYVRRPKCIDVGDTIRRYLGQLDGSITATRELSEIVDSSFRCVTLTSDILTAPSTDQFDLMVTSPPYPNAYSYHLYHRTRLIWLGYEPEAFKKIEIGSHRKYSAKGPDRATEQTFKAEFEKIFAWLRDRLRSRRHACFVIGNSTLDGKIVDNATLISSAGAMHGFREVACIKRNIAAARKSFNPVIGKIKTEKILILQKA